MSASYEFAARPVAQVSLTEQLAARLGDALQGVEVTEDGRPIIWLKAEAITTAQRIAIDEVMQAHNPETKSDQEKRAEARLEAHQALQDDDLKDLATLIAEVRDSATQRILERLAGLFYKALAAQGMTIADDPTRKERG